MDKAAATLEALAAGRIGGMAPTAQDAFNGWLLKVGVVSGGTCLLVLVVCAAVAVLLIANSRKKRE